jgi:ribosomal-protein-serine acetyltransferase
MFSVPIGDDRELRLLYSYDAPELFGSIDRHRAYLKEWLPWLDTVVSPADSLKFIESSLEEFVNGRSLVAAICVEKAIVGMVGLNRIDTRNRIGYIGYWLAPDYQGRGIMTDACRSIVDYCFNILNLNRIVIACATDNHRSRAIPQRLGFHHEGTARDAEWLHDRFVSHEIYSLLRREWIDSAVDSEKFSAP